jgi:hypothetical protein
MISQAVLAIALSIANAPTPADVLFAFAQEDSLAAFDEDGDGTPWWTMADQYDGDTLLAVRALRDGLYASRVLAWKVIDRLPEIERAKLSARLIRSKKPALADAGRMLKEILFRCPHCGGSRGCGNRANFESCEPCSRLPWIDPGDEGVEWPCRACGASGLRGIRP